MASTRQQKPCLRRGARMMVALCLILPLAAGAARGAGSYPRETIEAFLASCQGNEPLNAVKETYCRCMIGVLQSHVPYFRFAEWERRVTAGERVPELDEEVRAASKECGR
jgi:hypothetical protein